MERVAWRRGSSHQTGNAECKYFRFPETVEASGLYDYLLRNREYIVYHERQDLNKTKTQVAESHIDSVLNARHKKTGKMQWSRGAHNVLQIRAEIISKGWPEQWQGQYSQL